MTYTWIDLLKLELEQRKSRNCRYSLRAFARDLGIHASDLSKFLRGSRTMVQSTALTVLGHLDWDEAKVEQFVSSLFEASKSDFLDRLRSAQSHITKFSKEPPHRN